MKSLSIKKPLLARQSDIFIKILFLSFLFIAGILFFVDWKASLMALTCHIIIFSIVKYILSKHTMTKIVTIWILVIIILYYVTNPDLIIYVLSLFFLFPLLFIKDIFLTQYDIDNQSEVFYIDSQRVKCISIRYYEHRQYALDSLSYKKTLNISDIKSISFSKNKIEIAYKDTIYHPLQLNKEDIEKIKNFVESHFSNLFDNPAITENKKTKINYLLNLW